MTWSNLFSIDNSGCCVKDVLVGRGRSGEFGRSAREEMTAVVKQDITTVSSKVLVMENEIRF